MKSLYLLLLVVAVQGNPVARMKRETQLRPPDLVKLTAVDPPGFEVEWNPVENPDKKHPVLGYKLKVWELKEVKNLKYKVVNGVQQVDENYVEPTITQMDFKIPEGAPATYLTDKTKYLVNKIKIGVLYEVRVQAYTDQGDGPLSNPMRIKLHKNK